MAWIASCWHRVMALLGPPPDRGAHHGLVLRGEIGKYVPGAVWPVLAGASWPAEAASPARAYPSVAPSLAALYLAALALAAVLVPLDLAKQAESPAPSPCWPCPSGLAALHPGC